MLQEPGDSSNIAETIKDLEERAGEVQPFIEGLLGRAQRLILAYNGLGYLAAQTLYWVITTLDDWSRILLGDAGTLAYYTLVYSEPVDTIFYAANPASPSTIQYLQAADLTGYRTVLLTVDPRNDFLRDELSKYNPVYISAEDELEAGLLLAIASYKAGASRYRDRLGRRGERLHRHGVEGFWIIADELADKYRGVFHGLGEAGEVKVSSPRMIEASAEYIVEALRRRGVNAHYEPLEYLTGPGHILLLATRVDEYLLRERRFKLGMTGARIHYFEMNTDPLEAQVYYAILAYLYSRGLLEE